MRRAREVELAIAARPVGALRQRWLYDQIRSAILSGRLAPGTRLPATRDLARQHGVSRGTVLSVFDQLASEGYLSGTVGRGTFVAPVLPEAPPLAPGGRAEAGPAERRLSVRGEALARTPFPLEARPSPIRAFRPNQPELAAFPSETWNRLAARRARLADLSALTDGDAFGLPALRASIAEHLRGSRGILCGAEQIAIVGSVQQVIDLCARLLLDPGDRVWMEDPGYSGARILFEAAGAELVWVPVDDGGLAVEAGRRLAPGARLAYVTAGRQMPLGMPLALERRLALLAWAREAGATLLEDDYDSEYRFSGSPLAALKSLDPGGRVVYAGTFSKLLFPALRIAYAVLPEDLVPAFRRALSVVTRHAPLAPQAVLQDFIAEGHFGRHLRRMRLLYAERAEALQEAVRSHLRGLVELPPLSIGLDTPAYLPEGLDDGRVAALARQAGLECNALSAYAVRHRPRSGLQLGFAAIPVPALREGVLALRKVVERALRET